MGRNQGGRSVELRESCAGGIVFAGDRLLILQKQSGDWVLPKGHIEAGEMPSDAALREVREETGIETRILARVDSTNFRFQRHGRERLKTVSWFLMETDDATGLCPEPLFRQAQFVRPDEAIRRLTFANDRGLVEHALRWRQAAAVAAQPDGHV